jgi:hypothetical protein
VEERLKPQNEIVVPDVKNIKLPNIQKFESKNLSLVVNASFDIINDIRNRELLTEEDANNVKKAHEFLESTYSDVIIYNPRIVKVTSILSDGKFPTNDAKFWQCKMQAEVHFNEFVRGLYKLDRVYIDMEELQWEIASFDHAIEIGGELEDGRKMSVVKLGFDKRRLVNKLNQYMHEAKLLEKDIKQRLREINEWAEIAETFKKGCDHSTSNYEDHTINSHFQHIKGAVEKAKTPEEKKQYMDYLSTFMRLLGKDPKEMMQHPEK